MKALETWGNMATRTAKSRVAAARHRQTATAYFPASSTVVATLFAEAATPFFEWESFMGAPSTRLLRWFARVT